MSDDRSAERLSSRELLLRTIVRIRQDTVRVDRLLRVLTATQAVPAEVNRALRTIQDWSQQQVRQERQARRHKP